MAVKESKFLPVVIDRLRTYGLHAIGNRAIPDGRDGLKPVSRRIIWAAAGLNATSEGNSVTTGRLVGDTFGKYHPHSDDAIAKAIATLAQGSNPYPLIQGIGAWGNHSERAAQPRYTSCYLSKLAMTMLDPDELACTTMIPNYDDVLTEPLFLPSPIPYFLLSGSEGIAYGVSLSCPPHKPAWIKDAIQRVLDNRKLAAPSQFDYRWGGVVTKTEGDWLGEGALKVQCRPTLLLEREHHRIILTSLIPKKSLDVLENDVKSVEGVIGFNQVNLERSGAHVTFLISIHKSANFNDVFAALKPKLTGSASYRFIYVLRKGEGFVPVQSGIEAYLQSWVKWRKGHVAKVATHRKNRFENDLRKNDLFLRLIDRRDAYFKQLKAATNREDLVRRVQKTLTCSAEEATVVLASAQSKLSSLDKASLLKEIATLRGKIKIEDQVQKEPNARLTQNVQDALEAACLKARK